MAQELPSGSGLLNKIRAKPADNEDKLEDDENLDDTEGREQVNENKGGDEDNSRRRRATRQAMFAARNMRDASNQNNEIEMNKLRQRDALENLKASYQAPEISKFDQAEIYIVSVIFDIINMAFTLADAADLGIPLGDVIDDLSVAPLTDFTLYVFYKSKGLNPTSKKNRLTFFGLDLIELIPWIKFFPWYSINAFLLIRRANKEYKAAATEKRKINDVENDIATRQ